MKRKFFYTITMMVILICVVAVSSYALTFTATMTPSATSVGEESEFAVKIKVSNLDVGSNGINSLSGYLKYDTEVFETITESSIEGLNGWTAKFDASTGKIEMTKTSFVTSAQEVINIAFKTKSGVSGKSGAISYKDIVASNSESDISASDISTSITIGTTENSTNTTNSTNTIQISGNTGNTSNVANITSINTNTTNDTSNNATNNTVSSYVNTMTNTTSQEDMPKTGVNDTLLILIFVVIAIAMVFYLKIDKLNRDLY